MDRLGVSIVVALSLLVYVIAKAQTVAKYNRMRIRKTNSWLMSDRGILMGVCVQVSTLLLILWGVDWTIADIPIPIWIITLAIAPFIFYHAGRTSHQEDVNKKKQGKHFEELAGIVYKLLYGLSPSDEDFYDAVGLTQDDFKMYKIPEPHDISDVSLDSVNKAKLTKLSIHLKDNFDRISKWKELNGDYHDSWILQQCLLPHLETEYPAIKNDGWEKTARDNPIQLVNTLKRLAWTPAEGWGACPEFTGECEYCTDL